MSSQGFLLSWVLLVVLVLGVRAQVESSGIKTPPPSFLTRDRCTTIEFDAQFKPWEFSGTWYAIAALPNLEENAKRCNRYRYSNTNSGFSVQSDGYDDNSVAVQQSKTLTQVGDLPVFSTQLTEINANITIIATDYTSYACLLSCYELKGLRAQFAWILSRELTLTGAEIGSCQRNLRSADIPIAKLARIEQGATCSNY